MDWQDFIEYIDQVIELAEEIESSCDSESGSSFASGVQETLQGIREWVEKAEKFTLKQEKAVKNIESGLQKWTKDD